MEPRFIRTLACLLVSIAPATTLAGEIELPERVRIEGVRVEYRQPGEFLNGERAVNGALVTLVADEPFEIMKRQVTAGEYRLCVEDGACVALASDQAADLPVVGVNWDDAVAYAEWLSRRTGDRWRLPSDVEWALAAGSRFSDDAFQGVDDPANPALRWLQEYQEEAARARAPNPHPRPLGSFGVNENGLYDLSGNVWEWTSTCYVRTRIDPQTGAMTSHENCGARIAEGSHRAYMTAFIRDPKAGACSVGIPPSNLGIRLVREEPGAFSRLRSWIGL